MLAIFCCFHREVPILLYLGFYPVCFISNSFELYFLPYLYIGISLCYVIYLFLTINFYINFLLFLYLVLIIYLFILGMRSELFMFLQLCCFQGEVIGNEGSEMIFFTGKTISETAKVLASKSAYKGFSMAVACSKNSLSSELLSYV